MDNTQPLRAVNDKGAKMLAESLFQVSRISGGWLPGESVGYMTSAFLASNFFGLSDDTMRKHIRESGVRFKEVGNLMIVDPLEYWEAIPWQQGEATAKGPSSSSRLESGESKSASQTKPGSPGELPATKKRGRKQ